METSTEIKGEKRPQKGTRGTLKKSLAINWDALKIEFLTSPKNSVTQFLREKEIMGYNPMSGFFKKKTRHWAKEKAQLYKAAMEDTKIVMQAQVQAMMGELYLELGQAKLFALNALIERLRYHNQMDERGRPILSVKDIVAILHAIKTELGEPTKIPPGARAPKHVDLNHLLQYIDENDEAFDQAEYDRVYMEDMRKKGQLPEFIENF